MTIEQKSLLELFMEADEAYKKALDEYMSAESALIAAQRHRDDAWVRLGRRIVHGE